jgi:hypothetical protein
VQGNRQRPTGSPQRRTRDLLSVGLVGLVALTGAAPPVLGLHNAGVARCNACHVMHDSSEGLVVAVSPSGEAGLLIEETPSDVCLRCHATELGAVLGTNPLLPPPETGAGNFVFLFESNLNDAPDGATNIIPGEAAGHNLVAPGHGLAADARHSLSPGGSFPAGEMGCTSCHDPHGNDNFRHLHGAGPVQGGLVFFSDPAPDAEGIGLDGAAESNGHHTAYRSGMSDELVDGEIRDRYNAYNGDDDPLGGSFATAYLAAVPFEDAANATTSISGAGAGSRVMCLTCHRAHATSSPAALRWDYRVSLLNEDGVVSGSYPIPNPYASPTQGTLCNKCHEGGAPDLVEPTVAGISR